MYLHHTSEDYDMCSQVLGKQLKPQFPEHKSQTFTWCHVVCHAHTTRLNTLRLFVYHKDLSGVCDTTVRSRYRKMLRMVRC